jgi:hypothetical protein
VIVALMAGSNDAIEPMDLANMRENGIHSLDVYAGNVATK